MGTTNHPLFFDDSSEDGNEECDGENQLARLKQRPRSPGVNLPTVHINGNNNCVKDSDLIADDSQRNSPVSCVNFDRNSPASHVSFDDTTVCESNRCRSASESCSSQPARRPSSIPTVSFATGRTVRYSEGEIEHVDDEPKDDSAMSDSEVTSRRGRSVLSRTYGDAIPFSVSSRSRFHSEAKNRRLTRGVQSASMQSLPSFGVSSRRRTGTDVAVDVASDFGHKLGPPSDVSPDAEKSFGLWSMTSREKFALVCLFLVDLTAQMCLSIMAPFFPAEASKKHVSATVSGWIFGVFALVQFIASPFYGKLLPRVGSRFMITAGQFFSGGCIILFGLLDYVDTEEESLTFIILCFVIRICLALGCTASSTASFAVTANIFPDHVSTVFGLLETAVGLGMMMGPALGGVLYEAGGFILPFVVLGGFMVISVPVTFCCLPSKDDTKVSNLPVSLLQILRIPAIIVVCLSVIMAATLWSIMDPTLAPHLSVFMLSPTYLGLLFLFMSALYALFSPFWGWLSDKFTDSSPLIAVGFIVCAVGLLLLGPSPLLGFSPDYASLPMNIVALGILGISVSLAIVPTFDKILCIVEKAGIEDSFSMYSYVAGIWGGCYALGEFIGPSFGGMLVDSYGFAETMTFVAGACVLMAAILFIHATYERYRRGRTPPAEELKGTGDFEPSVIYSDERTPLLSPSARPSSVPLSF